MCVYSSSNLQENEKIYAEKMYTVKRKCLGLKLIILWGLWKKKKRKKESKKEKKKESKKVRKKVTKKERKKERK